MSIVEGVVAVPVTKDGNILAIWDGENAGKKEKLGWDVVGKRKSIEGRMQFIGGVSESKDLIGELIREGSEEAKIKLHRTDFEETGVGTLIDHQRAGGELMMVGVSIYWLLLSYEMERLLRSAGAVDMTETLELRERDMIIYGLIKDKVPDSLTIS